MTAVFKSGLFCKTPFQDCVKQHTVPVPSPSAGQVLLKVAGSSINPCDVDYLEFGFGCSGGKGTLGMDAAGTIVAVGEDVRRLKVGDEVWADGGGVSGDSGTMADYALMSEEQTGLKPKSINATLAATIPLVGLTALE
jgi:NADPH2:quinone reductase